MSGRSSAEGSWLPEYDALLERIASTDDVEGTDWDKLRDIIKHKIQQNISIFLTATQKPTPLSYLPTQTENGGLKLPPFPPRTQLHIPKPPPCYMDEQEANTMKQSIFQQLDQFEGSPPFTIQRLCELCTAPGRHYNSVGKYLRAVEKSVLVTSTMESFPPLTEAETLSAGRSAITLGSTLQSAPSTPLFSPIPFLHDDARRSKSRSPPLTPLILNPDEPIEMKALGLVDELDDPRPGHLSDHPTALSSVTTLPSRSAQETKPFLGSLEQRFVKAEEMDDASMAATSGGTQELGDAMELDDDKENTKT